MTMSRPKVHWTPKEDISGDNVWISCGGAVPTAWLDEGRATHDRNLVTCLPCQRAAFRATPGGRAEYERHWRAREHRGAVTRAVHRVVLDRHAEEVAGLLEPELAMLALGEPVDAIIERLRASA